MIRDLLVSLISNYSLSFLVIGILSAAIAVARLSGPKSFSLTVEKLLAWHVFWAVGVGYLYNFVMHGFFAQMSAAFIGWADSPFQFEVATASLGFAAAGFIAAFRSFDSRLVAIVGPSLFTLGAAVGHVREMVKEHNYQPGNAGVIFYMDIVIPLFGLGLLWLSRRNRHQHRTT